METFYLVTFAVLALGCAGAELSKRSTAMRINDTSFFSFRNNYLVVYALMMAGDWLQGPYVYALYSHYGYEMGDIGRLFIAGFGASMIFGTLVGSMSDKFGRKKFALIYVACYVGSCITKHWSNYWVLMFGRLLGGIATSLLFSVFESWLCCEHFARGFSSDWLGDTFSRAVFWGNGLVAIVAGLLANWLVDNTPMGPVAPFDAAAFFLIIGGFIIAKTWNENYGESDGKGDSKTVMEQFKEALALIATDRKVAILGAMQGLFEASMYTFVFMWTPALSSQGEAIPHGTIFACFMVACMMGSALVGKMLSLNIKAEGYMQYVFAAGTLFIGIAIPFNMASYAGDERAGEPISRAGMLQMLAFCGFEAVVGMFWPSMMAMRAVYVPEDIRATLINVFRMPLNLFVCLVLANVSAMPVYLVFAMCTFFLAMCTALQITLGLVIKQEKGQFVGVPTTVL